MLARELKKNKNCEIVIALTHMRTPNDVRLAENVAEIDLILGGHDHIYEKKKVCKRNLNKYLLKSLSHPRAYKVFRIYIRILNKLMPTSERYKIGFTS